MPDIIVKDLGISYYKNKIETNVFTHLNITFKNEKFNVLMGVSGSGKTTLLSAIAGLSNYAGEIYYNSKLMNGVPPYKRNISFVNQNYVLYPHMTVFENIAYPLKTIAASPNEIKERVIELAKELNIEHCLLVKPKFISGGQQQRVAIARALIKRPDIMIFDEPLSNLDVESRSMIRSLIKNITNKYHVTVIYSSHDINDARLLADTITIIHNDNIIQSDNINELITSNNDLVKEIF